MFTVVSNCFAALECTEHSKFNLIIIQKGLPQLDILAVLKVLRAIGDATPIVSMEKAQSGISTNLITKLTISARKDGYAGILLQPYSANSLCECITNTLEYAKEHPTEINDMNVKISQEFNKQLDSKELDIDLKADRSFKKEEERSRGGKRVIAAKTSTRQPAAKSSEVPGVRSSGRQKEKQPKAASSYTYNGTLGGPRRGPRGSLMEDLARLPGPKPGEEDRAAALLSALSDLHARTTKNDHDQHEVTNSLLSMATSSSSTSS